MKSLVKSVASAILPPSAYRAIRIRRNVPERAIYAKYVKRGDTVLDIGANIGWHSYMLSGFVGNGAVHSFEPIPSTCDELERLVKEAALSNVIVHRYGCGDQTGRLEFVVPSNNGVPVHGWAHLRCQGDTGIVHSVPIVRIDEVITDWVSFIKCDTEGAELFALRGAERLISRCRPTILCEVEERWIKRFGHTPEDVFSFMRKLDYSIRPLFDWAAGSKAEVAENYLFLPS